MKNLLVLLAIWLCIQSVIGFRHHEHHKPEGSKHSKGRHCSYQTDKGSYDLRLLVRDMNEKDWELKNQKNHYSFFFSPCGPVHNKDCGKDSAMCLINEKNIAVSFGKASNVTWSEMNSGGVEIIYGDGEKCDNDVPRKTVVQLTCSKPTQDKETHRTVITDLSYEGCLVTFKISSPYGCPVEELCTVYDQKECEASEGLCGWKDGSCVFQSIDCWRIGKHHISATAFIAFVLGSTALFALTCLACCCCCSHVRKRRRQRAGVLPTSAKKSNKEEEEFQQEVPETQFIYQPLQQYPGQYTPGAFPMVQLVPMEVSIQNE